MNPKTAYVLEQMTVSLSKWFVRVALPTLGATMVGALAYLLLILGLGLTLTGCVHSNETVTQVPAEPQPNETCLNLVHATCNHYALCYGRDPIPAYNACQQHFRAAVFKGPLCVDPGVSFRGPVDACIETLDRCGDELEIELVCGAVQIVREK